MAAEVECVTTNGTPTRAVYASMAVMISQQACGVSRFTVKHVFYGLTECR